jgi:iduronate 2-sulfatase
MGSAMAYLSDSKGKDVEHTDGKVATEAIKLLEKHKNKPFFIAAGFYKPHTPWITPKKYFDIYNQDQISLPKISSETPGDYPELALASTKPWPYFGITADQAKECKLAYFAAISFVDAQIGRLLNALDSLGLSDNTIIVFWSDHGYHLGEHGLWFKQSCFEESAKCPLIISVPGAKSAGTICHRTVELIDIYPTLAELTGLTPPDNIQGYSLLSLLNNPNATWKHPAFTQVQRENTPGHSVRTEEWRFTEWGYGKMGEELYNEVTDPEELNNLAADPKYADLVQKMKNLLHKVHPVPVTGGKAVADTRNRFCN